MLQHPLNLPIACFPHFRLVLNVLVYFLFKFCNVQAVSALAGVVVGFSLAIFAIVISATVFLWFYGSFWTTALVVFLGGYKFDFSINHLDASLDSFYIELLSKLN